MSKNSLLEKYYQDKSNGKIIPEIQNCLELILLGYVGRFQHSHHGKEYCCRSQIYCPVQSNKSTGFKPCRGSELTAEYVKKKIHEKKSGGSRIPNEKRSGQMRPE